MINSTFNQLIRLKKTVLSLDITGLHNVSQNKIYCKMQLIN